MIKLGFKKLNPNAVLPKYAHPGDAGMDICAVADEKLYYGAPTLVGTGLAAEIPEGYELQVRPRSGLACKGITVWNSPGTIDAKYRGEIKVILFYYTNAPMGNNPYEIKAGDRIAQLVLAPITTAEVHEVTELSETERGAGGFGSTGR